MTFCWQNNLKIIAYFGLEGTPYSPTTGSTASKTGLQWEMLNEEKVESWIVLYFIVQSHLEVSLNSIQINSAKFHIFY